MKSSVFLTVVIVIALGLGAVVLWVGLAYGIMAWRYHNQTHTTMWYVTYPDIVFDGDMDYYPFAAWSREAATSRRGYDKEPDVTILLADGTELYVPQITQADIVALAKRIHGDTFEEHVLEYFTNPTRFTYQFGQNDCFTFVDDKLEAIRFTGHGISSFSGAKIARGKSTNYLTLPATRAEIEAAFGKPLRAGSGSIRAP